MNASRTRREDVAGGFREAFGRRRPVRFIGGGDTVESPALNAGKRFHDATLDPEVAFGYHALAMTDPDNPLPGPEHRATMRPYPRRRAPRGHRGVDARQRPSPNFMTQPQAEGEDQ